MPQIDRKALEKPASLRRASSIVESFCNDQVRHPGEDVYKKSGICKVLAEEYCPLVALAQERRHVRSVRLFSEANPGPDGEIRFWRGHSSKIQITCANEGYNRALMREQLASGNIVFPNQSRRRDKKSGEVVSMGRILSAPEADVQARVKRILDAIEKKEKNFYPQTDTLLVQDDVAKFRYLREGGLHKKIRNAVCDGLGAPYKRIYIRYGDELKRIK
jgi:hypothetical protein